MNVDDRIYEMALAINVKRADEQRRLDACLCAGICPGCGSPLQDNEYKRSAFSRRKLRRECRVKCGKYDGYEILQYLDI